MLIWYIQHELDIKLTFNFLHLCTSVYVPVTTRINPVGQPYFLLLVCVGSTYFLPDHQMISQFGFSDDVKTAIWPASVPILDGWREQLQLDQILRVTFWRLKVDAKKRGQNLGADGPGQEFYTCSMRLQQSQISCFQRQCTPKRVVKMWALIRERHMPVVILMQVYSWNSVSYSWNCQNSIHGSEVMWHS